ncbi:tetratricopeptide repeat protein [Pedobacter caeni]|uniref:Uncharacterized protein n=1 Tax=Pedobacter caeni TaxID=288992 RepID=A0A1M5JM25_9SPHI|nr:hypothetical protein [Pedobacter caeni]SHG41624.1 hypothetical protein SAMN04488522_105423 [Pedobacter caeni]
MDIADKKTAKNLERLMDESEGYWAEEDYAGFVQAYLKAWDMLPVPKEEYDDSYHLAEGLAEGYLLLGNHSEAMKWAEIMSHCDLERLDDGEREYVMGKVLFESGDLQNAKEKFAVAMTKSAGRAFISGPEKYTELLKKNDHQQLQINNNIEQKQGEPEELDDELYEQIESLSEEGNEFVDEDDYAAALEKFKEALVLVPEPKTKWEAAFWLYASMGDMYLFLEDYEASADAFYYALNCPDGQESGFVHLRLGEALYEINKKEDALQHLLRAYMLEGKELFNDEEEKYYDFLKNNVEGIG